MREFISKSEFFDARNQGPTPDEYVLYTKEGDIVLPTCWAVCSVCNGEGKHVKLGIDGNGISTQEFNDDPDFADEYFSGAYDVTCNACRGRTTVRVVDETQMSEERIKQWYGQLDEEHAIALASYYEKRLGA